MNIAYIVPSLAAKGPVVVVNDLVKEFTRNSHRCTVYYFDDIVELEFDNAIRIDKEDKINFLQYDIVHSHGIRPDSFVAKNREYSGRVKYVSTLHNYMFVDLRYQYNWFVAQIFGRKWLKVLQKMDTVVALSKDAMRYYSRWFSPEKLTYAYNTRILEQKPKDVSDLLKFKGDSILIGVNALLTRRKGIDILIDALPLLPECKLFIAGDGVERKILENQAQKLGVYSRCYFAGFQKEAYLFLPHYDIYALPSRSEGFPLALLEAAQYSKRCVTSDLPILKETFQGAVEMFELNNPQGVTFAIKRAIANKNLEIAIKNKFDNYYSSAILYNHYFVIYSAENY